MVDFVLESSMIFYRIRSLARAPAHDGMPVDEGRHRARRGHGQRRALHAVAAAPRGEGLHPRRVRPVLLNASDDESFRQKNITGGVLAQ